jgi:hypothetical protein
MSVDFTMLPKPYWIAGDNAYPDGDHLMTPFLSAFPSSPENSFNSYLSQLRITGLTMMADPRFETEPVAATPRLLATEVQRAFETTTLRRESLCDILQEAGGQRPVASVAQRARALQQELAYANPLQPLPN